MRKLADRQSEDFARVKHAMEWPVMLLSLVFIGLLIARVIPDTPDNFGLFLSVANWIVLALFAIPLLWLFYLAPAKKSYLLGHWPDIVVIVLGLLHLLAIEAYRPAFSLVFIVVLLLVVARQWGEILQAHRRRGIAFVVTGVIVMLFVSAYIIYHLETPENPAFDSYGISLWWTVVTASTTGYGDIVAETVAGRVFTMILLMFSVATYAFVSATIAAQFVMTDQERDIKEILERLQRIEERLERADTPEDTDDD